MPLIEGLLARGREGARVRSGGRTVARSIFKNRRSTTRAQLRRADRTPTRLLSSRSGTNSASRTSRGCKLMKQPVIFDGRNLYDPTQIRALGFTYSSIGRPMSASWSPAAPATSAATPSRRSPPPATTSSSTTTCRRGTARRSTHRSAHPGRASAGSGRHPRHRAVRRGAPSESGAPRSCTSPRGCSVGESVREPLAYYRVNVGGTLRVLEAMAAAGVRRSSFRRPPRRSANRRRRRSTSPIRSGRSTRTARRSSRSSARCRTSSARTASDRWRSATSTPPARTRRR